MGDSAPRPLQGRAPGRGGESPGVASPRRRWLPPRICSSCAAGPSAGGCPGCALRAAHPVPGQRRPGPGLRSVIRSGKPEPCRVPAGPTRPLSPPGVLSSVQATPSLWKPDTGKDFARVLLEPEVPPPRPSLLTSQGEKCRACRLPQTPCDPTRNRSCPYKLH